MILEYAAQCKMQSVKYLDSDMFFIVLTSLQYTRFQMK